MIYDASTLSLPLRLEADLCIVGSGPGGAMVAREAVASGLRVIVLEAGAYLTPGDMTQREEEMFPQLFWEGGGRTTRDRAVKIHQGKGVGGSSLHNLNLCKRIPETILSEWARDRSLSALKLHHWARLYEEVETLLQVSAVSPSRWSQHNLLLQRGCEALGWRGGGLHHNRTGCIGSGFCEVGCAYDAKNNALKVVLSSAVEGGCQVLSSCQATRVEVRDGAVVGVTAQALHTGTQRALGEVYVSAPAVALCASATGTPALLQRSDIPDPSEQTGRSLRIHPAVLAAGDFDEPVHAWRGIPQTYECTEFLRFEHGETREPSRLWIVPAFAHPVGTATMLPGMASSHGELMRRYPNLGVFTAMLHDHTRGQVQPRGDLGVGIDYWPDAADRAQLAYGIWACARLLFAAGAKRVLIPTDPVQIIESEDYLEHLKQIDLRPGAIDITAVHPMASVPMGDDPRQAAVNSRGKHHHVDGLWVADASLFPSSIGVPPQLSTYALGLHVGRSLVEALR